MGLRMKNFNIMGVHWKIQFLSGGGGVTKNQYIYIGFAWEGGAWTVCRFKGGSCWKRGGGVFEGRVDTPMHTIREGGGGQGDSVKECWTSLKNLSQLNIFTKYFISKLLQTQQK